LFILPVLLLGARSVVNVGVIACPEQSVMVVERLGRYHRMLTPGLHFTMPWPLESMRQLELRERPYHVKRAPAITRDNVDLFLDGVVYLRIVDPFKANYAVADPIEAMLILAQTTVRSRIGEMTLDQSFKNREELNSHVITALQHAGEEWGIVCTRYEVKDIEPPESIMQAMKAEAEAERKKRATVLESEGVRQAHINTAEGEKASRVLESEAHRDAAINEAVGAADAVRAAAAAEADRILTLARAQAGATELVANALCKEGGELAARVAMASEWIGAFSELGGRSSTLVVPADTGSVPAMLAQAMACFDAVNSGASGPPPSRLAKAGKAARGAMEAPSRKQSRTAKRP